MSAEGVTLRGISISGAEAGTDVSYAYMGMPSYAQDMNYYVQHGMNTVRIPINWDYIVNNPNATQASVAGQQYLNAVKASLEDMLDHGLNAILDLHSYMRFSPGSYAGSGNQIATAQQMHNVWTIISNGLADLAREYPDTLMFEIANEPNSMSSQQMLANNNAGIDAIRDAGLTNMVILNGNNWTGLHSWREGGSATDGISNAQILTPANIVDPLHNYAISVHQYVDWNGSGTSPTGQTLENFKNYLKFDSFMNWVREHDVKVILGEFGGGNEANAIADVNYLLQQVEANGYVEGEGGFIGWTAWIGGHTWAQSNFNYIGPNPNGTDNALMDLIYEQYLDGSYVPPEPTPNPDPVPTPTPTPVPTPTPTPHDDGVKHNIAWNWGAREVINNFDAQHDVINLGTFWKGYNDFSLHNDGHGNLVIDLLGVDNHLITLTGVTLSEFSAANLQGVTGGSYQNAVGEDAKYYSFKWNYGLQTEINDFNPDAGIIDLQTFSGKQFSDLLINNDANGNANIKLAFNGQLIKLIGVNASELTADNFIGVNGNLADALAADIPQPTPTPDPTPVPDPTPDPDPTPAPDPTPVPTPTPEPTPTPVPTPVPTPTPGPVSGGPAETFAFGWNWGGRQVINDFDVSQDKIDLTAFWTNYDNIDIQSDGDGNVVIDLLSLNNQTITLTNTSLSALSQLNFKGIAGNYGNAVETNPVKYYNFNWNYGAQTTIDNFNPDIGVINLSQFNQNISNVHIADNANGDAVINLGFDQQAITLLGVSANEVGNDNFLM